MTEPASSSRHPPRAWQHVCDSAWAPCPIWSLKLWQQHFSCICRRRKGSSPCMDSTSSSSTNTRSSANRTLRDCFVSGRPPIAFLVWCSWATSTSCPAFTPPVRGRAQPGRPAEILNLRRVFEARTRTFLRHLSCSARHANKGAAQCHMSRSQGLAGSGTVRG